MSTRWLSLGLMWGNRDVHDALLSIPNPVKRGSAIVSLCDNTLVHPVHELPPRSMITGTFRGEPVAVSEHGYVFLGEDADWRIGHPSGGRDVALMCNGTIVDTIVGTGSTDIRAYSLAVKWGLLDLLRFDERIHA